MLVFFFFAEVDTSVVTMDRTLPILLEEVALASRPEFASLWQTLGDVIDENGTTRALVGEVEKVCVCVCGCVWACVHVSER